LLKSKRKFRMLGVVAVAAGLLTGGTAAASAAPAVFSGSGGNALVVPSFKVRYQYQNTNRTLTCPATYLYGTAANSGTPLQGVLDGFVYQGNCAGGGYVLLQQGSELRAVNNGTSFSLNSAGSLYVYISALGTSTLSGANVPYTVPWTNPVGTTPAKITYADTLVGKTNTGYSIYLTATMSMGPTLALS
jgi:hypothetical protein